MHKPCQNGRAARNQRLDVPGPFDPLDNTGIGKAAQTFLEYPPVQKGASFNLEQLKAEMEKRAAAAAAQQ
jgi:hypothetical protein